jgi:membrane-associated phospholipid phosphatase
MSPSCADPHQPNAILKLQPQAVPEVRTAGSRDEVDGAIPPGSEKHNLIGLRATVTVAVGAYVLALAGSALLHVRASVLDGVPLCLGPAAFLCLYSRLVFPRAVRIAQTIEAAFLIIVLGLSLACLSYLGAMANLPLRDQDMISIERQLGFDWLEIMRGLDRWPAVLTLLDGAYATFTSQLIATVLVLILARRTRELDCFFLTFVCATLIAEITSALIPTLGPMATLAGSAEFSNLATLGHATGDTVLALRQGTLRIIELDAINGIISFPSLHAAVAVIVPFTLRWNRPLFWPLLVLDGTMLVSTVPSGNHYLSDVLGGVLVAVLAIACGRGVQKCLERLIAAAVWNFQSADLARLPRIIAAE